MESGAPLRPPGLHILALIEKVETSHERKGEKIVTAHVNLLSGARGEASFSCTFFHLEWQTS